MSEPEASEEEELKKEIIQFMISLHQRGLRDSQPKGRPE